MGNCLSQYFTSLSYTSPVQQDHQLPDKPSIGTLLRQPQQSNSLLPTSNLNTVDNTILGRPYKDVELHYAIGKELGRGLFGTTFMCTENTTGRQLACKSISKSKLKTKRDEDDIKREIHVMKHLSGLPNVVEFIGAYEDAESVHIVMEFCAGGELFDRIKARGHFRERDAASIFRAIMNFVDSCHASGVMHRDIKPENLLFSNKDEIIGLKAIDFGMSAYFEEGKVYEDVVGSLFYVAPEVLRRRYGKEADIWSAGVVLYVLLSGVQPFWAGTEQGIYDAILLGNVSFENPPWPTISSSAKELICKMLTHNPKERITSAQVLEHPWIKENGVAPDKPIAIENGCPFKDEAIQGDKQIHEACTEDCGGEIFNEYNGTISCDELKVGLAN